MAEEHQARVSNVVEEMVQSLERDHIRKMQVDVIYHVFFASLQVIISTGVCVSAAGSHVQVQCRLL